MKSIFLILFIALQHAIYAQGSIENAVEALLSSDQLRGASVSLTVLDQGTGELLYGHDIERCLIPASTMKAITTGTALQVLKPNFRFHTHIYLANFDGKNHLIFQGFGDPTWNWVGHNFEGYFEKALAELKSALKAKNISKIDGSLWVDGRYYGSQQISDSWQWNDLGNYYATGIAALNYNGNQTKLVLSQNPKLSGPPKLVGIQPEVPNLEFVNELKSGSKNSGDQAYIYGAPNQSKRFIRGSIPLGSGKFYVKGSVPNPLTFTGHHLKSKLEQLGLKIEGEVAIVESEISNAVFLGEIKSQIDLTAVCKQANSKSDNFLTEAIGRKLGVVLTEKRHARSGPMALEKYWSETQGVNLETAHLEDVSGLSARNRISSFCMAEILRCLSLNPDYSSTFLNTLSGQQSLNLKALPGQLYVKSGSMNSVRAYTGVYVGKKGTRTYSFIVNNYSGSSSRVKALLMDVIKALPGL